MSDQDIYTVESTESGPSPQASIMLVVLAIAYAGYFVLDVWSHPIESQYVVWAIAALIGILCFADASVAILAHRNTLESREPSAAPIGRLLRVTIVIGVLLLFPHAVEAMGVSVTMPFASLIIFAAAGETRPRLRSAIIVVVFALATAQVMGRWLIPEFRHLL